MQIYSLTINNKKYIGKTTQNIKNRLNQHLSKLSRGIHSNYKLQEYYNLYGPPTVDIVEDNLDNEELLNIREIFWIQYLDTINSGLNITLGGEGIGHGENHPSAKCCLDDYLAIVTFLAETDYTQQEISKELEVPLSIVNNISSGYTHQYLIDIIPDLYKKMLQKASSRTNKKHIDNIYYQILVDIAESNLTYDKIAEKHGINKSIVGHIASGNRHTYLKDLYPEEYYKMLSRDRKHIKAGAGPRSNTPYSSIKSPNGEIFNVNNVRQFAIKYNLTYSALNRLVNKKAKSHKGWTLV